MNNLNKIYVHRVEFPEPECIGYGIYDAPPARLVIEVDRESIRGIDFSDLFLVEGRNLLSTGDI